MVWNGCVSKCRQHSRKTSKRRSSEIYFLLESEIYFILHIYAIYLDHTMNVLRPSHCSVHQNWRSDAPATLTVSIKYGFVQLLHTDSSYMDNQLTDLQLSPAEAADLADRIRLVASGERANNGDVEADGVHLVVTQVTDGDPYREGVNLALVAGDWNRDFNFEMTIATAADLARSLVNATGQCGAAAQSVKRQQVKLAALEPVAWQSRFVSAGDAGWSFCSREHHEKVLATPSVWEGYETRELYSSKWAEMFKEMRRNALRWQYYAGRVSIMMGVAFEQMEREMDDAMKAEGIMGE